MFRIVSLDVGCGFNHNVHYPSKYCDIGLDLNLDKMTPEYKILWNNRILIMASAQDLPFRINVFNYIQVRALLEHLVNPFKCVMDIIKCLKKGKLALITLPIITSHQKHYLKIMFTQFPFGVYDVIKCMIRIYPYIRIKGFLHSVDVQPENIIKFFNRYMIIKTYYKHKWFYGVWGKFIKKYITNGIELKDSQGYNEVYVWK